MNNNPIKQKQIDQEKEVQSRLEYYNINNKIKIILMDIKTVNQFPYKTTRNLIIVEPEKYGITDRYCGGNVDKCAEIKGQPYVLLLDKIKHTLGVHIPYKNLHMLTVTELVALCKRFQLPANNTEKKDLLINKITYPQKYKKVQKKLDDKTE